MIRTLSKKRKQAPEKRPEITTAKRCLATAPAERSEEVKPRLKKTNMAVPTRAGEKPAGWARWRA